MEHLDRDTVVKAVTAATAEVFSTMLGLEVRAGEPFVETAAPGPAEGVVSLVGLAGSWMGTGSFSCSACFACRTSSQMLMTQCSAVDGDVLDAIAEVTNMIIGNVKSTLEEQLGPMGLSIPTVVFGKNFTTKSAGNGEWTVVPFFCGEERITVKICLTPNRHAGGSIRHGFTQSYSPQTDESPAA